MNRIPVVLYDTSILILMFKENVKVMENVKDIVGLHIAVVPDLSLSELERLARSRERKTRIAVNLAREIIRKYMSIMKCTLDYCDDCIVEACSRNIVDYVVTCDMELRSKLQNYKCRILYYLTSKNRIVID